MEITCHGWAVVVSKPAAEFAAQDALQRRGYRVCLPVYRKVLRGKRPNRGGIVMRPLFQGYLFVELHPGQGWVAILHTPDVSNLVRRAGEHDLPALLDDGLVEAIKIESEAGAFDEHCPNHWNYQPGDEVSVKKGPFTTFVAKLRGIDARGRADSLVSMFNREVPAALNLATLDRVSA